MFQKVLIGYDGSKRAKAALRCAAAMAMDFNMKLTALWVREPLPRCSDLPSEVVAGKEAVNEYFDELCKEIKAVVKTHCLDIRCVARAGHPAKTIVQYADEGGYDLIVVGHSGHSELWGRLLGDTADRISDHAHCSVLIVKTVPKISEQTTSKNQNE
ncbi:MAG TPA: universal stress protein [Candidatus Aquilonibacter sp.]|nr:universal stress protein [Candidatus Aquilonibacter sp.]